MARKQMTQPGSNMIIGGGGDGSYVSGEMLKQVDTPVETLLGAANGALSGAAIAGAVSAAATFAQHEGRAGLGKTIVKNMLGTHKLAVIGGTAVLGALGAVVRFSRARKHNEWSERHYEFLEQQTSHVARVEGERDNEKSEEKSR